MEYYWTVNASKTRLTELGIYPANLFPIGPNSCAIPENKIDFTWNRLVEAGLELIRVRERQLANDGLVIIFKDGKSRRFHISCYEVQFGRAETARVLRSDWTLSEKGLEEWTPVIISPENLLPRLTCSHCGLLVTFN